MKDRFAADLDGLFQLPLAGFISARNTLASQLKKAGRADDAAHVKTIAKPSISVWAINQLYWQHREQFDELIAAGQRFRRAHTRRSAKTGELNEALAARREALDQLSDLSANLLRDAGHNPTLEMMRRVATTLEAMSAYAALPDGQVLGRLTQDLDPPGFESLAPFIRAVPTTRRVEEPLRLRGSSPIVRKGAPADSKATKTAHRDEDQQKTRLATTKSTLQNAKKSLAEARAKVQSLRTAQKKADAEVKNAEKQKRVAEQRFKEASTASAAATVRAQNLGRELERATKVLDETKRTVVTASKELELLLRNRN